MPNLPPRRQRRAERRFVQAAERVECIFREAEVEKRKEEAREWRRKIAEARAKEIADARTQRREAEERWRWHMRRDLTMEEILHGRPPS